jgi:hypothetical protein
MKAGVGYNAFGPVFYGDLSLYTDEYPVCKLKNLICYEKLTNTHFHKKFLNYDGRIIYQCDGKLLYKTVDICNAANLSPEESLMLVLMYGEELPTFHKNEHDG